MPEDHPPAHSDSECAAHPCPRPRRGPHSLSITVAVLVAGFVSTAAAAAQPGLAPPPDLLAEARLAATESPPGGGQTETAQDHEHDDGDPSLEGEVRDTTGLALPGVTVLALHTETGASETAVTDRRGSFAFTDLPPGEYEVTLALAGFHTEIRRNVAVTEEGGVHFDVTLTIEFSEQVIVVGSRANPRSVTDSPVPIDAIPLRDVMNQGATQLDFQLRNLVPSFNVSNHPISGSATLVRPATLRNLSHDHTLVLVNGKRRHRSSILVWFGGVTDGTQGPDISTIPSLAVRQVEVLRDGASAQYGSDAIAGVLNFSLKDSREGGSLEISRGAYRAGDGDAYTIAGNAGLPLGESGFANLSFEYGNNDPTDRSVQRADAAALTAAGNTAVQNPAHPWGDAKIEGDLKLFGNFGQQFDGGLELYAHANYANKDSTQSFYFRNPNTRANIFSLDSGKTLLVGDVLDAHDGVLDGSANCPVVRVVDHRPDPAALARVFADPNCFSFQEIAPGGFTPRFTGVITEVAGVAGVRRASESGFVWDLSASYGAHESDYFLFNTVNASFGPETPRDFNPGLYRQEEINLNADVSFTASERVHLAAGAEWRDERFTIEAGERPSWEVGPFAPQGFLSASNGYPGFPDYTAGTWTRSNIAVYGDVELHEPSDRWLLGGALRVERFETFGATTNGKLSGRYLLADEVSIRGAVSTGFRAPTPGQQNAFNVQSTINPETLDLVDSATVPSTYRAAELRGGKPLDPETATSVTGGVVVDAGPFTLTADAFQVDVSQRLAISRDFILAEHEREALLAEGITSAGTLAFFRFFINDFATRTRGFDVVSTWAPPTLGGATILSLAMNYTDTEVTEPSEHFSAGDVLAIERGVPSTRWIGSIQQRIGRLQLLGRAHYYGSWVDVVDARSARGADAQIFNGKLIFDLEATLPLTHDLTLSMGGQNILNTFSDPMDLFAERFGLPYAQSTPWGFSGGYFYARLRYDWQW